MCSLEYRIKALTIQGVGFDAYLKALGGIPSVGQVVVKKDDKTGKYKTELLVRKAYLTSGSYLYSNKKKSEKKEEKVNFIMDTISGSVKR